MTRYVLPFVFGVAVALVGVLWNDSSGADAGADAGSRETQLAVATGAYRHGDVPSLPALDRNALVREIRGAVRDEVAQQLADSEAVQPDRPEAEDPRLDDPEFREQNERAYSYTNALIDSAIETAYWGDQDAREFRGRLNQLTSDQIDVVLERLTVAINSDQLRVETSGMPF